MQNLIKKTLHKIYGKAIHITTVSTVSLLALFRYTLFVKETEFIKIQEINSVNLHYLLDNDIS